MVKVRFHHLWVLLEIFSRPWCSFQTWTISILPPHLWNKGSTLGKDFPPKPKFGKKKAQSDLVIFSLSPFMFLHNLFILLSSCFLVGLVFILCVFCLTCFYLFVFSFVLYKNKNKNWKIRKIQKPCVFVYFWYLCTLDGHWNKISKFCISCNLDEHLYAQLSKWAL